MNRSIRAITLCAAGLLAAGHFAAQQAGAEALRFPYAAALLTDGKGDGLKTPQGAACGLSQIAVADTGNGRVLTYEITAGIAQPRAEIRLPQLMTPAKLQMNARGEIYALDEKKHVVVRLKPDGSFDAVVSPPSILVWSFALAGDDLYLLDTVGGKVLALDRGGAIRREIAFPKEYGFLIDIAAEPDGTVYALDAVQSRVFAAAKGAAELKPLTQTMKEYLLFPGSLTVDRRGLIFIADRNGGSVAIMDREGKMQGRQFSAGWKEGLLRYPAQVCVMDNGTVVVADRENNRVQVFAPGQ